MHIKSRPNGVIGIPFSCLKPGDLVECVSAGYSQSSSFVGNIYLCAIVGSTRTLINLTCNAQSYIQSDADGWLFQRLPKGTELTLVQD